MNKKSLLKSISVATAAIALIVSSPSLVSANTSEANLKSGSVEKDGLLWGELSNDAGACHAVHQPSVVNAQKETSVALEKAYLGDRQEQDKNSELKTAEASKVNTASSNYITVCSHK